MKKTTITPNRFIIYTQSWWAKSAFLLSFLVILFSCEEDLNFLGFSNQQRFKVYYAEIPVESSVLWMDSLSTVSFPTVPPSESSRLLFGKYVDPIFGSIEARTFAQFRPAIFPVLSALAQYDSVLLQLRYDFYSYGTSGETNQTISIYEITEVLNFNNSYFFNSPVAISNNPLATADLRVNADYFKEEIPYTSSDSVLTAKFKLANTFGQRLFDAINAEDTLFTNATYFTQQFKGLAIVPQQSDKVVGIDNFDPNTALTLYYHEEDVVKSVTFSLATLIAFTQINSNRSGSELDGLNTFYSDFTGSNNRHIQNGTSIVTKLDFSKFYEYMDTIPRIIINSAELSLNDVGSSTEFAAPQNLSMAMLRMNNRNRTVSSRQDSIDIIPVARSIVVFNGSVLAANDAGGLFALLYSSDDQTYLGYPTIFFQRLFNVKESKYPYWALTPVSPLAGKAVNRTVFPKDNIKLKIYYTRPLLNEN